MGRHRQPPRGRELSATGVAGRLLGEAAEWLRLGHVDRLLDYSAPEQEEYAAFLKHAGFRELTRTTLGRERRAGRT